MHQLRRGDFRRAESLSDPTWLIALLLYASGVINILEALFPKQDAVLEVIEAWLPVELSASSRVLLLLAGLLMFPLARGVRRHKKVAFPLTILTLAVTAALHLGHAFDWHHLVPVAVTLALLISARKQFVARSDRASLRRAVRSVGVAAVAIFIYGYARDWNLRDQLAGSSTPGARVHTVLELMFLQSTDTQTPLTPRASAFFDSVSLGALAVGFVGLGLLLRPVYQRRGHSAKEHARVEQILAADDRDPMSTFHLLPDKSFSFFRDSFVGYAVWRNFAIVLGDPVGPRNETGRTICEFATFCGLQDWEPVFTGVPNENVTLYERLGFDYFKIAEDARIRVADFNLAGGKFQNLRTACNKARRLGQRFKWYGPESRRDPALEQQLQTISDTWLARKRGGEMTFDLGQFSIEEIRRWSAAVMLDASGVAQAFVNWRPYAQGRGRCADLMRYLPEASGAAHFLIVESLQCFREIGVEEVSLGNAPLANVESNSGNLKQQEKAVRYIFEHANQIYGYKSLFEFKARYQPHWRGRYLIYRNVAQLPLIAYALVHVHAPNGVWKFLNS